MSEILAVDRPLSSPAAKAKQEELRKALNIAHSVASLAVDTPAPLKIVPRETPVDRVRAIAAAHEPPTDWRDRLAAIAPESLKMAWLTFGWLEKVERWVIYECIPEPLIPQGKRDQLGGTPYWKMPETLRVGRQQAVSAYQWEMYRKQRVWARPFWCLQGPFGGTPARYSELEEAILKASGQETTPPHPGTLPYAAFDGQAEHQVRIRDRLWKMGGSVERLARTGSSAVMKAETAEAERAFRETFLSWMQETLAPQAEFIEWFSKSGDRMAGVSEKLMRPATDAELRAGSELEDQYIETGIIPFAHPE
jgi:hypothetical protein